MFKGSSTSAKPTASTTPGRQTAGATGQPADTTQRPAANPRRVVIARQTHRYEQRTSTPKMRVRSGRQRSLRIETRPVRLPRWKRIGVKMPSLKLRELTPARVTSLVLAVALLGLLVFVLENDAFYIYSADIQGNRLVSAEDVYGRSGLDGRNIFFANARQAERLIADVPYVKSARVTVGLPAQVQIEVEERQPVVAWQVGGNRYGVADDGTVIPPDGMAPDAPTVQAEGQPLKYGVKLNAELVAVAQHVRDLVPDAKGLLYSQERGIGVMTAQDWPVYFGMKDDAIAARVSVLNGLLQEFKQQKIQPEFVDLSLASRPYYRLKGSATQ
ncbi:MAG: FtsQ-type POTRA domain-containing protein [Anaerolineae bacterium]